MKRSMCGLVVLAAAAGLVSCNGDPTGDGIRQGEHAIADPTSVFIGDGESKFVIVELVDGLGNQLAADFEAQSVGPGITVVKDTTFLQTTIGTHLETSKRFSVTGTAPVATSFQLVSGQTSVTVPVKVTPASTTVTFSNPTPAANEGLVITLPAGYKFGAGAGANVAGTAGIVQAVAADSSSITVLLPPGTTGPVTVDSVAVDFVPGVLFSLPTADVVTVGAVTPQAGTGATATAPALPIPAVGSTAIFYDGGAYDYASVNGPARLYKITVADTTTLTTTLGWAGTQDFGIYFYASNGTTPFGTAADSPDPAANPESETNTFPPGTYFLAVTNFSPTNPPYFSLSVTNEAPAQ